MKLGYAPRRVHRIRKTGDRVKCPLLISLSAGTVYEGPSPRSGQDVPLEFTEWLAK